MSYNYLKAADIRGKTVLLRVDLNEEVDENGHLMDNFRIQSIVPTIKFLRDHDAKVVVLSHAGRPEGKWNDNMSLRPMALCLAELMLDGESRLVDLTPFRPSRFAEGKPWVDEHRYGEALSISR